MGLIGLRAVGTFYRIQIINEGSIIYDGTAPNGMFRKRHYVKPGVMNYLAPVLLKLLPNGFETRIWQKIKEGTD